MILWILKCELLSKERLRDHREPPGWDERTVRRENSVAECATGSQAVCWKSLLLSEETRNSQNPVSAWEEVSESQGTEEKTWKDPELGPQRLPPPRGHTSLQLKASRVPPETWGAPSASFHILWGSDRKAGRPVRWDGDDSSHPGGSGGAP